MDLSVNAVPKAAHHYRLPELLQDIRLLDLLEISGTTLEAARAASLSQPTVSRRTRVLADDFQLQLNRRRQQGCRYGSSTAMRLLRLGCRAHRLAAGVARLGADVMLQPLLLGCDWLLPAPPRFRAVDDWLDLVHQGVLDGALVSGLEFPGDDPPDRQELDLLQLGSLPLALATDPTAAETGATASDAARAIDVLVPNRAVALGLQGRLADCGLQLRSAGHACQTSAQWLQRLRRAPLAMALPRGDGATGEVEVRLRTGTKKEPLVRLGRDFKLDGELAEALAGIEGIANVSLTAQRAAGHLRLVA